MTRNETFDNCPVELPDTDKILEPHEIDHTCLFCGQGMEKHWDEYRAYYECDCEDVRFNEQIYEQIRVLREKLRKPKFVVERKPHLVAIKS